METKGKRPEKRLGGSASHQEILRKKILISRLQIDQGETLLNRKKC